MPRLQFSIRVLLLLMAIVGVSITVFRWPWTVTTTDAEKTVVTPYRRSWNGKAVKHGMELTMLVDSGTVRAWYVEGELRRQREERASGFVHDESVQNGQLDGPFYQRNSDLEQWCFYRQGMPEGTWKQQFSEFLITSEWHGGELHGAKTWSLPGKVLQSAEYERGKLVGWNNLPLPAALEQWMDDNQVDDELRLNLLDTFTTHPRDLDGMALGRLVETTFGKRREHVYWIGKQKPTRALVISPYEMEWLREFPVDRPVGEVLLARALDSSTMFVYRYHRLGIVRISATERDWHDRTGVYRIRFEPGSKQEEFWLAPGRIDRTDLRKSGVGFQGLLYDGNDIPIPFNTSAIDGLQSQTPGGHRLDAPGFPRPRRDMLGDFLNDRGYFCELLNGELVFKPHPETVQAKQE